MFIPYRVIQLKQKSKKYYKNAETSTQLNTTELFEHCITRPMQKFNISTHQPYYQYNKTLDLYGKSKNTKKQQRNINKGSRTFRKEGENKSWRLSSEQHNRSRKSMKSAHSKQYGGKGQRYEKYKEIEIAKTCVEENKNQQAFQDNLIKDLVTISLNLQKIMKTQANSNFNQRKYKSIDLDDKERPSTFQSRRSINSSTYNTINVSNLRQDANLNKSLSFSRSKTKSKLFDLYMGQLRKKHNKKNIREKKLGRQANQPSLRITTFSNTSNSIINEEAKKIEQMYINWRNCDKIHVAGKSINTSKIIKCLKNEHEIKCNIKAEKSKQNNAKKCSFGFFDKDEQVQIKGWRYAKNFDNFDIDQLL